MSPGGNPGKTPGKNIPGPTMLIHLILFGYLECPGDATSSQNAHAKCRNMMTKRAMDLGGNRVVTRV
jgi:hypothetical protein